MSDDTMERGKRLLREDYQNQREELINKHNALEDQHARNYAAISLWMGTDRHDLLKQAQTAMREAQASIDQVNEKLRCVENVLRRIESL